MNTTLKRLLDLLTQANVSSIQAARVLGGSITPGTLVRPMQVTPGDPAFARAEIMPGAEAEPVYTVELTPGTLALHLDALSAAFGPGNPVPRSRPGQPARQMFQHRPEGASYFVTVFASHDDSGSVGLLLLRRDPNV